MYLIWVMWTHRGIPEIRAFETDVLLLIAPDSMYTMHSPITLGTLHTDMAIKLAMRKELEDLNMQWKRSLIVTKLTMKEAWLVYQEDVQIVSKIDNIVKIARDTTIIPFGTAEVKGVIKAPNHYKHVTVVLDDLPENQHYKDIVIMQQVQILKPGSNKIPLVLQKLSCRVLKIRKGTKIPHVETSNVVPSSMTSRLSENVPEKVARNSPKNDLLENLPKGNGSRLETCFLRV